MKEARLDFHTDFHSARKAYHHICKVESMNPYSILKITFHEPDRKANPPSWSIYIQNMETTMTELDIKAMLPQDCEPTSLTINEPLHSQSDAQVLTYIQAVLDQWLRRNPNANYVIKMVKRGRIPLREAVATFTRSGVTRYEAQDVTYAYYAMLDFLKVTETQRLKYAYQAMANSSKTSKLKDPNEDSENEGPAGQLIAENSSDEFATAMPTIQLHRRQAIHYTIPIRFANLIEQELSAFQSICVGCNVQIKAVKILPPQQKMPFNDEEEVSIYINTHEVMNAARAKSALSLLLEGSLIHVERITSQVGQPLYHDWFASPDGILWTREMSEKWGVFIHVDFEYKRITVHGPRRKESLPHIMIYVVAVGCLHTGRTETASQRFRCKRTVTE